MEVNKWKVLFSFGWKFLEKIGTQVVNFIVTLILARILDPDAYGSVAIIMVFISVANVFVQGGFNTALIQKKDADELDYSTVFVFSMLVAVILYAILFLCAPAIAEFYMMPQLRDALRVMALILIPGAANSIQVAYATKVMDFKRISVCTFISLLIASVVGITGALIWRNIWALVVYQLLNQVLLCCIMFFFIEWRPACQFSLKRLKKLVGFSGKILASNLLTTFFLEIRSLIIGKVYSSSQLAYFNKGKQFPQTLMDSINTTIQTVMLPAYSIVQEQIDEVKRMVRKSVQISTFCIYPMMIGLCAVSEPLINILLTEKWNFCVPYLNVFAITYMFQPMQITSAQAIKALGDSATTLKLEIIRKIAEIILLIIAIPRGVYAIAVSTIIAGGIGLAFSLFPNVRKLNYSIKEQALDTVQPLLLSAIMYIGVKCVIMQVTGDIGKLVLGIGAGIVIYIGLAKLINNSSYIYIINLLKKMKRDRRL